jgi:hypothetical protein
MAARLCPQFIAVGVYPTEAYFMKLCPSPSLQKPYELHETIKKYY